MLDETADKWQKYDKTLGLMQRGVPLPDSYVNEAFRYVTDYAHRFSRDAVKDAGFIFASYGKFDQASQIAEIAGRLG